MNFRYQPPPKFYFFTILTGILPLIARHIEKVTDEMNIMQLILIPKTKFDYIVLAFALAAFIYSISVYYFSRSRNRVVVIEKDKISSPKSLINSRLISVKLRDISAIKKSGFFTNGKLVIIHKEGKLKIAQAGFENHYVIDRIYEVIRQAGHKQKIYFN
ncbi:MAG: hypothetical protein COC24_014775 [Alphaproteobacteria bacterium]|nr:hypothetical protein [Alphaproteobacteria bacterium]